MRAVRGWVVAGLVAAWVAGAAAGCAGGPTTSSTGEYIDDSAITAKIKANFVADRQISAFDIKVETFRGVVILAGFVNTEAQKDRAVAIARGVANVREVKADGLVITPRRQ